MTRIEPTNKRKSIPLIKVDLVYYFAIHKEMNPRRSP
jgi:hypothetical protein